MLDVEFTPLPDPVVPDLRISSCVDTMSDVNSFPRHLLHVILLDGGTVQQCDPVRISWGMDAGTIFEATESVHLRFTVIG
jgi:hypothetical protein